jgi:hypothetical protein
LRHFAAGAALLVGIAASAVANCEHPTALHFAAGTTGATVAGGLARGERDCFSISARTGQHLTVTQTDQGEGNIVVQIYQPPWTIVPSADGPRFRGRALEGSEEGRDAQHWTGRLPATGSYLLVVGTSRGGGEYSVRVEVH